MTGTLTYATHELAELGSRLGQLAADLRQDGKLAHVDKYDVADESVADALGDFAGDWENNREALASKIESLGQLASEAAKTFTQTDSDLASKAEEIFQGPK